MKHYTAIKNIFKEMLMTQENNYGIRKLITIHNQYVQYILTTFFKICPDRNKMTIENTVKCREWLSSR